MRNTSYGKLFTIGEKLHDRSPDSKSYNIIILLDIYAIAQTLLVQKRLNDRGRCHVQNGVRQSRISIRSV